MDFDIVVIERGVADLPVTAEGKSGSLSEFASATKCGGTKFCRVTA